VRDAADVVSSIAQALTPRAKLVVVDHVTAQTALVLPVAAVAAACRARGVPVLVDGAHAPGSLRLDIASLGVDWYAANLPSGRMPPRLRHPLGCAGPAVDAPRSVVSWGRDRGFHQRVRHITARPDELLAPEGIALLRVGLRRSHATMHEPPGGRADPATAGERRLKFHATWWAPW
jgi:isopenicillin-N epimerase